MNKSRSRSRIFCALTMAVLVLFGVACVVGFAACGDDGEKSSGTTCTTHTVTTWDTNTATCTDDGVRTGKCDVCGETVTEEVSATGHDYVADSTKDKAATCGEDGYTYSKCSVCGAERMDPVYATGEHEFEETSDSDGNTIFKCKNCSATTSTMPDPGTEKTAYKFEAEEAELVVDENEMYAWLYEDVTQGNYIADMGFIFDVQEDGTASGGLSVGYLAHNNPTATFKFTSDKAYSVSLTLHAASCHIDGDKIEPMLNSYVFGMMNAEVEPYVGSEHDILTVNGQSVPLTGTLPGSDSVFTLTGDGLNMNVWGTLTATIELTTGENEIVLTHDGAGVNWDYIEIETSATLTLSNKTTHTAGSLFDTWYDSNYVYDPDTMALVPELKEW